MATPETEPVRDDDPFGTAELRAAVLASWQRSPARFREDANAEESLARVGYAGRVLVELAANAADAAAEAGVAGRLKCTLVGDELRVANTGAPLTATGVAALASLRASAKRDRPGVGRFGVGFSAVRTVSDELAVVSTSGSVAFSRRATLAEIAGLSTELDLEVDRRGGDVPVLRLPFPVDDEQPADGFDTEVRVRLRPDIEGRQVLAEAGDHLLLALPALTSIELPDRTISRVASEPGLVVIDDGDRATRWQCVSRSGAWHATQRAELPVEQRERREWQVTWAYPVGRPLSDDVLYCPTPTDEPLRLPARLLGTFPVDDTRRHVVAGPLTDLLLDEAVQAYLDLLLAVPADERLPMLPEPGFGRGELDNRLRLGILEAARRTPILVTVVGEAVRPDVATMLPSAGASLLTAAAQAIPGLIPAPATSADRAMLRALGVATLGYPDMSAALGAIDRPAAFWRSIYAELDPAVADDLADLPVPLASGRTVLGARGCLLLDGDAAWLDAVTKAVPQLRIIHPDATRDSSRARDLLIRLGAEPADPSTVLAHPALTATLADLRERFEDDDVDTDEVDRVATVVLDLIAAAPVVPAEITGSLLLTDDEDQPWPAAELALPGSAVAGLVDGEALAPLHPRWLERHPSEVLRRAGVVAGFRVVRDPHPSGPDHDLPDEEQYWEEVLDGRAPDEFTAIADLDLVRPAAWPAALALVAADRETRSVLTGTARVSDGPASTGTNRTQPGYTSWWLARFAVIGGAAPREWRLWSAADLAGLYEPVPVDLDPDLATAIGVRASLSDALADDVSGVLARWADPGRRLSPLAVGVVTSALVEALRSRRDVELPDGVRTLAGTVADADAAVVLDAPWLAQLLDPAILVPACGAPDVVAQLFDLDPASARFSFPAPRPTRSAGSHPSLEGLAAISRALGGAPATDLESVANRVVVADGLTVDGRRVSWWLDGGDAWTDGSPAGWARLIAHFHHSWQQRHLIAALLAGDSASIAEHGA